MRRALGGLSVLAVVLVALLAAIAVRRSAQADVSEDVSTRIYQVEFDDWVLVSASAMCGTSNPDYDVSLSKQIIHGRRRFKVVGNYANTPAGLHWFQVGCPKIHQKIDALCRGWTAEGNRISVNDFDFEFRKSG